MTTNEPLPAAPRTGAKLLALSVFSFGLYPLYRLLRHARGARKRRFREWLALIPPRFGLRCWTVVVAGALAWFLMIVAGCGPVANPASGWLIP